MTREAITRKQERNFLEFVKNDNHFSKYYEGIYILFKTGLRISEFTGLTIADVDLEKGDDVKECFCKIIQNRQKPKVEPMIDGKAGFLYLDKNGMPMVALHWEKYFQHICEKYNKICKVEMPKVTPHVCRHTFCSNMAKSGMNPKTLQKIMGHCDIGVTLNTYTHLDFDDIQKEMKEVCNR